MNYHQKRWRPRGVTILAITLIVATLAMFGVVEAAIVARQDVEIISAQEASAEAYRAANSGLELGMLYYSYNHDVSLGTECENAQNNCPEIPTATDGLPLRIYIDRLGCSPAQLQTGQCDTLPVDKTNPLHWQPTLLANTNRPTLPRVDNLPNNERVVDLKIYYQQKGGVGKATDLDSVDPPPPFDPSHSTNQVLLADFPRDFAIPPTILNLISVDLHLAGLTVKNPLIPGTNQNGTVDTWKSALDIFEQKYGHKPNPTPRGNQEDINFFKQFCSHLTVQNNDDPDVPCGVYTIVDIFGMSPMTKYYPLREITELNPNPSKNTVKITTGRNLRLKPLNMDIQFALDNVKDIYGNQSTNYQYFDSGVTHILATGYYAGKKRTLEIQIDRKKNQIYGIFDFALYTEGALPPQ